MEEGRCSEVTAADLRNSDDSTGHGQGPWGHGDRKPRDGFLRRYGLDSDGLSETRRRILPSDPLYQQREASLASSSWAGPCPPWREAASHHKARQSLFFTHSSSPAPSPTLQCLCVHFLPGRESPNLGPALNPSRDHLQIFHYICEGPVCIESLIPRFWADTGFWWTLFDPLRPSPPQSSRAVGIPP